MLLSCSLRSSTCTVRSDEEEEEEEEEDDEDDEPADCKRYLCDVLEVLQGDGVDVRALWQEVTRVVQLTLNAIHPDISLTYSTAMHKAGSSQELLWRGAGKKGERQRSRASSAEGTDKAAGAAPGPQEPGEAEWRHAEKLQDMLFSAQIEGDKCFQMLGFDILLDKQCKPYIIEINHNPSFKLPTPLDVEIKTAALAGCLGIVCNKYMPYPLPGDLAKAQPPASEHCEVSPESVDAAPGAAATCARRPVPGVNDDQAGTADATPALVGDQAAMAATADASLALELQRAALFKVTGLHIYIDR